MSEYNLLRECVRERGNTVILFDEAEKIAGVPIDHSF